MKTGISTTALLMTALISLPAFAQTGIGWGVKAGRNSAVLSGDGAGEAQSISGIAGGLSLRMGLLGLLTLEADALYSPKGCRIAEAEGGDEIRLAYISFPVVLKKKFFPVGLHPFVLGGFSVSSLLSAEQGGSGIKDLVNSRDTAGVVGAGIEFSLLGKGALVEARYEHGLDQVFKSRSAGASRNRVTQVFFGLLF